MISILDLNKLHILSVLAKPRNNIIYKVSDGISIYALKVSRSSLPEEKEAFFDEYETIRNICHPVIPSYYGYYPDLKIGDSKFHTPAILMEYIEGTALSSIPYLTTGKLKKYIMDLGDALLTLLNHGVLYMDLHPGNLIIKEDQIHLIDYTKAYYYLTNPNPSYLPKISYKINQHLPGQQILIQALTFFILHLQEQCSLPVLPASLLQLGEHPHDGISFSEFLLKINREWETN